MRSLLFLVSAALVSADGFSISAWTTPCSGVNGAQLHAAKNGFYTGISGPLTYCPLEPASCPQVVGTLVSEDMKAMMVRTGLLVNRSSLGFMNFHFYQQCLYLLTYYTLQAASTSPLYLWLMFFSHSQVAVPGGQRIFVQPDGQVKFSIPHSAYIPDGSITDGWHHATSASNTHAPTTQDTIYFDDGKGHSGLTLCPEIPDEMKGTGASLVLYAKTVGFSLTHCTDIGGLALNKTGHNIGCWQYE
jgi:hypothetical protein